VAAKQSSRQCFRKPSATPAANWAMPRSRSNSGSSCVLHFYDKNDLVLQDPGTLDDRGMPLHRPTAPTGAPRQAIQAIPVSAWLLGERLDTRVLEGGTVLATSPLAISTECGGVAVVFRYGAVVLFGSSATALERFLAKLDPLLTDKLATPEREELQLLIQA